MSRPDFHFFLVSFGLFLYTVPSTAPGTIDEKRMEIRDGLHGCEEIQIGRRELRSEGGGRK